MNTELKNKLAVKSLSLGHFTVDAYSGFLNPVMPFIAANIGISMTVATMIMSVASIVGSCSQPFFGYIADGWKRRFFIFWGLLLASFFISAIGLATNLIQLFIFIVIGELGIALYHPQATSFVPVFAKSEKLSRDISIFIAMGTFGFSLGPAIASIISANFGLGKLIYASVFGIALAFFLMFFVPRVESAWIIKENMSLPRALKEIFSNKTMSILILAATVKSFISSTFLILLPFYWKNIGWSVSKIGFVLFLYTLFGAFGILTSPHIEKKFGIRKTFYSSFLFILPLTILFAYTQSINDILGIAVLVMVQFCCFLSAPVTMSMAQKLMPEHKSMTAGFIGGLSWGVIGLILPLFSLIAEHVGIMNVVIAVTIIPLLFCNLVKYLPEKV
ncbi:MFS transporter [bacterium]|nr:MFS transporter [bacterium]